MPVKEYEASALIAADPATVWSVLTDAGSFTEWESGIVRVEGRVEAGRRLKLVSEANPTRAFPIRVAEMTPPRHMTWVGGMPFGLFRGTRTFTLEPEGDITRFRMRERYSGPLAPMVSKSIPDLQPSFDKFAAGLKARAESRTANS